MSWHGGTAFDPPAAGLVSPQQTSPTSTTPGGDDHTRKRKRSENPTDNGDPDGGEGAAGGGSAGSPQQANGNKPRHQPGVKRACNDCRQQKLRCNVVAGPGDHYKPCDRCIKHNLKCSIDDGFKRLGKRAQHDEMAKELDMCKAKLARFEALGMRLPEDEGRPESNYTGSYQASPASGAPVAPMGSGSNAFLGASEAAASRSLLDLSQGYRELAPTSYPSITPGTSMMTLGSVTLTETQITELYRVFFDCYHVFLPVLNPELPYKTYYEEHPLLHWTIISVAARKWDQKPGLFMELQRPLEEILWNTLAQVPQSYHVCKALALLCTWPLPTSSTSQEPTMMLCGVMFQLAMQYGLHRPSHAQDFMRFRIDLREEDISDRLNTWATVNIVAQNVATGNGLPPLARWAWFTYGLHLNRMKPEIQTRCQIEKFCDTVTRTLYTMQRDHVVEVDQAQRGLQIDMYARELGELEVTVLSTSNSPVDVLYLKTAQLHLRLTAFFDKPQQPNYYADLRNVYIAASALLQHVSDMSMDQFVYVPRYIEQMMLAAGATLMKILNSFYAAHVDIVHGRTLFSRAVTHLRKLSVRSNDLPQRLAEVMAQLWNSSNAMEQKLFADDGQGGGIPRTADESLQLKVRCRSSLSVLYDAIWRWRERVGQPGRDSLAQAVEHPTALPTDTQSRNTPQPPNGLQGAGPIPAANDNLGLSAAGALDGMDWGSPFGGNAVFDPLSWALDGNLGLGGGLFGGQDPLGAGIYQG
ncbi:hypothetical protein M409DRAFT_65475 [Zasmidium cellare ATCC 36951]|uniref:Zn(2)-C6 fungal-type domain-containing protein n=1 Tax=Zasmidium cellare ATCC 36951 TaxID=1080233 RepID=A0A6A6CPD4_ZASCE|nr:uncharacterized protein M409DRAFT_65475 [Zasmidium cellare ATCC 36951]KAF2168533.1 hypothetical protein M409DRAFT_65475 [Zasmidium cellare ATCC 36951]